jgi:cytochrome oxidase assembly protein ShyY1
LRVAGIIAPRGDPRVSRRGTLWLGWTLALLAMAGFARLGVWQYGRMLEKQALLANAAKILADRHVRPLDVDPMPATPAWVEQDGRVEADTLFLDNQQRNGRQGVHMYCVLDVGNASGGGHRLVDMGWLPLPGNRKLPDVACPAGTLHVRGLLTDPPSSGIAMGPPLQSVGTRRWLMTRVDTAAIHAATHYAMWNAVVRLDPKLPVGYERDLDVLPNTLPPERHLGYAFQWWALSLAVFVTALVLTFRKRKTPR